jgi:predicted nucleic acid-binding protein
MIMLLDNTVLSNFALVNRIELLTNALENQSATTFQVLDEFENGVARGHLPETRLDWLEVLDMEAEEESLFRELLARVNAGEASCLAIAAQRNGRVLTDDRDARKLAAQLKIPVSGTLGVLLRLVQINVLALFEANDILGQMIIGGYRSPVEKLEDL